MKVSHVFICTLAFLLLPPAPASAQLSRQIDSLRAVLQIPVPDSTRSDQYAYMSKFFVLQGIHFDSAKYYAQKAIDFGQKSDYLPGLEKGYFALAFVYDFEGKKEESLSYFEKAREILVRKEDWAAVATTTNNLGKIYFDQNKYPKAQAAFLEALRLAELVKDTSQILLTYGNIAAVTSFVGSKDMALEYLLKGWKLALMTDDLEGQLNIAINLAPRYLTADMQDSALVMGERALELAERLGRITERIRAQVFMASLYLERGYPQKTEAVVLEALYLTDDQNHLNEMGKLYCHLIDAYIRMGQLDKARTYMAEAKRICYASGIGYNLQNVHKIISKLEKASGNYEEALHQQARHYELRDSLVSLEQEKRIAELMAQYESEKKDREIADLAQKSKIQALEIRQKNILLLAILLLGLLMASAIYFFFRQRAVKEKQARMEAQQRLLQTQMNPHFLFNALSSIQSVIYEQEDPETATFYLARFAKLMRLILENSRSAYIPLHQEIQTLRSYLDLQKLRFENRFSYEIEVDPQLDEDSLQIPPMFAQPFLENSLEHGFRKIDTLGHIKVVFRQRGEMLELIVEDNGIGREEAASLRPPREHRSLALEIIQDRLQLLSDRVKKQFHIQVQDLGEGSSAGQGTKVTLSLPLLYQY